MSKQGKIKAIRRVIEVEKYDKEISEIYKIGDIVCIRSSKYFENGSLCCTGRISSIESVKGGTVIYLDYSALYERKLAEIFARDIEDIRMAQKGESL